MKKLILCLGLIFLAPLSQAESNNYDDSFKPCLAIYASDQAYYSTALRSEKLDFVFSIHSMHFERKDSTSGTMFVEASSGQTDVMIIQIEMKQVCETGKVVEL
jgi:hypothetical protein